MWGERPEDVVGSLLETVFYAQMLALFAPHTVKAASHLPLLLDTLAARQPSLRRAAAAMLRHLAERCARCGAVPCQLHAAMRQAERGTVEAICRRI